MTLGLTGWRPWVIKIVVKTCILYQIYVFLRRRLRSLALADLTIDIHNVRKALAEGIWEKLSV